MGDFFLKVSCWLPYNDCVLPAWSSRLQGFPAYSHLLQRP